MGYTPSNHPPPRSARLNQRHLQALLVKPRHRNLTSRARADHDHVISTAHLSRYPR